MSNGNLNLFVMLSIAGPASLPLFGQTKVEELMKIKPSYIEKFEYKPKEKVIALEMDFNSPEFQNASMASLLKGKSVIKVELYYTHFQMAQTFDQPALNFERYKEFKRLCPY